ncbi:hypothetical protein Y032_1027g3429 [Ancylostoma ceylanicum]|uniref:Uncharacterized protein n=1 Tax=Ancylostoma ceylanicum TaxID=53326 RepID=A0A016W7L5_9BILA|nr:hypothetical protein Y032_1027g3429 [Ancylostoma ceylanicum]
MCLCTAFDTSSTITQTFAELVPHVIEARIAKIGGVKVSFQLLFGCYSVAVGLLSDPYRKSKHQTYSDRIAAEQQLE